MRRLMFLLTLVLTGVTALVGGAPHKVFADCCFGSTSACSAGATECGSCGPDQLSCTQCCHYENPNPGCMSSGVGDCGTANTYTGQCCSGYCGSGNVCASAPAAPVATATPVPGAPTSPPSSGGSCAYDCVSQSMCDAGGGSDAGGCSGGLVCCQPPCFLPGTQITLSNGQKKNIEDIQAGDKVTSYNVATQTTSESTVGQVESLIAKSYFSLRISGDKESTQLKVTGIHPLLAVKSVFAGDNPEDAVLNSQAGFIKVQDLEVGDYVKMTESWAKITGDSFVEGDVKVYNLINVNPIGTYFANDVVAHNKGIESCCGGHPWPSYPQLVCDWANNKLTLSWTSPPCGCAWVYPELWNADGATRKWGAVLPSSATSIDVPFGTGPGQIDPNGTYRYQVVSRLGGGGTYGGRAIWVNPLFPHWNGDEVDTMQSLQSWQAETRFSCRDVLGTIKTSATGGSLPISNVPVLVQKPSYFDPGNQNNNNASGPDILNSYNFLQAAHVTLRTDSEGKFYVPYGIFPACQLYQPTDGWGNALCCKNSNNCQGEHSNYRFSCGGCGDSCDGHVVCGDQFKIWPDPDNNKMALNIVRGGLTYGNNGELLYNNTDKIAGLAPLPTPQLLPGIRQLYQVSNWSSSYDGRINAGYPSTYWTGWGRNTPSYAQVTNDPTIFRGFPFYIDQQNGSSSCLATSRASTPFSAGCNFQLMCTSTPTAPTNLTSQDMINKIQVSWTDASTNETSFEVCRQGAAIVAGQHCSTDMGLVSRVNSTSSASTGQVYTYLDNNGSSLACPGSYYYKVVVVNTNEPETTCQTASTNTLTASCIEYKPWFLNKGGDVTVNSALGTYFPHPDPAVPGFTGYFIAGDQIAAIPGMAFGARGAGWTGYLDEDNVSLKKWLVNTTIANWSGVLGKSENTYAAIKRRVLNKIATPVSITSGANISNWGDAQAQVNGVTVMTGTAPGTGFNIGATNFGTNKAIILIDGDVNINGEIRRNKTASSPGFVAIFASGNITVANTVGSAGGETENITAAAANPQLEGIYFAQGSFVSARSSDEATPNQSRRRLRVDGSVIGMSGVNLDNRNALGNYPTHFFNFQPDLIATLNEIGLRLKVYQELQAP